MPAPDWMGSAAEKVSAGKPEYGIWCGVPMCCHRDTTNRGCERDEYPSHDWHAKHANQGSRMKGQYWQTHIYYGQKKRTLGKFLSGRLYQLQSSTFCNMFFVSSTSDHRNLTGVDCISDLGAVEEVLFGPAPSHKMSKFEFLHFGYVAPLHPADGQTTNL